MWRAPGAHGADQVANIGGPAGRGGNAFSFLGTGKGGKGGTGGSSSGTISSSPVVKAINGVLGRLTGGAKGGTEAWASAWSRRWRRSRHRRYSRWPGWSRRRRRRQSQLIEVVVNCAVVGPRRGRPRTAVRYLTKS